MHQVTGVGTERRVSASLPMLQAAAPNWHRVAAKQNASIVAKMGLTGGLVGYRQTQLFAN
eukprot:1158902-Pelagomonas_calceolata.AAC.5